ncbi:MAG: hypothetical protein K8T25_21405 [Planctomycetia bacterium]|nr:hypothetical protein [Planctomycetia bacterium]
MFRSKEPIPSVAIFKSTLLAWLAIAAALALILWVAPVQAQTSRDALRLDEVRKKEGFWKSIANSDPSGKTGCRQIMAYALSLVEAQQSPERLPRLFDLLTRMQDRNPRSKTFGNLRWRWEDAKVDDPNAAEFCMHDALLIWLRHRDWVPLQAQQQLTVLMQYGLEGVLRHRVPTTYTNIALTRSANLIVLGEVLRRSDIAEEGQRRLDEVYSSTAAHGLHECVSPTYYGIDINALTLLAVYSQNERTRHQADALLRLLWTDIALNWFPATERMGGTYARTYDFLGGRGALDWQMWVNGWLRTPTPGKAERVEPYWNEWTPPQELHTLNVQHLPRLVRQSWGEGYGQSRTYMVFRDVGLSTLGAGYGGEDVPLAIDLAGQREAPRGFFRADDQDNPYGVKKHASGAGGQMKATHLTPFWIGAQRTTDALAMAIYNSKAGESNTPEAHLVLPRAVHSITIAGTAIDLSGRTTAVPLQGVPIQLGQPVIFRYDTAAVGVRLMAATTGDNRIAQISLVDDQNQFGCIRLTAALGSGTAQATTAPLPWPVVALWVRVGTDLGNDAAFGAWQRAFESAQPTQIERTTRGITIEVPSVDGPVGFAMVLNEAGQPAAAKIVPEPSRSVLELDGKEVGQPILSAVARP